LGFIRITDQLLCHLRFLQNAKQYKMTAILHLSQIEFQLVVDIFFKRKETIFLTQNFLSVHKLYAEKVFGFVNRGRQCPVMRSLSAMEP
jgi:hypothetical protein